MSEAIRERAGGNRASGFVTRGVRLRSWRRRFCQISIIAVKARLASSPPEAIASNRLIAN
jgi:hypothetical protein